MQLHHTDTRRRRRRRTRQLTLVVAVQWFVATVVTVGTQDALPVASASAIALGGTTAMVAAREPLVFRVQGSRNDPEYDRACRVVRGLEDLYGKERYRLHQVDISTQSTASKRRRWLLPQWLSGKQSKTPSASRGNHPSVVCSIEPSFSRAASARKEKSGAKSMVVDEKLAVEQDTDERQDPAVRIGGVEDLLEFVRGSVLAGPRPFSFAFHEQSLRLKREQIVSHRGLAGHTGADASAGNTKPPFLRGSGGAASNHAAMLSGVEPGDFEFDLVVIGGGSGGLACAKEAARLGQRVACLDFVKPSPMGSKWGLGGTCVNVGCIPKKLMHQAALHRGLLEDSRIFGWRSGMRGLSSGGMEDDVEDSRTGAHEWGKMVTAVQNYIKGLNFKYRTDLRSKGVEYLNALGRLEDPHTVIATDRKGKERVLSCDKVVVAVGGRPKELSCEGGELAITSDDLFSFKKPPGRTLVVGASYVALECAGFLTGLGLDVTVMVRSVLLRGFDQGIAERIGRFMESEGTRFLRPAVPHRISRTDDGRLLVRWSNLESDTWSEEEFDTVLAATGRRADVEGLGLESIGVKLADDGKMICRNEETTVPGVFGLGDAVEGVPELTPAAIQAGRLLARRLFGGSAEAMDYTNVATTVFTPLEYACVGLSEEDAIKQMSEDNVEVYHSAFTPLEWQLNPERPQNACYVKAVCDLTDRERIVGLHLLGPNAGEVMQGFGLGVRLGMTYDDLRQLVGIHPTVAEELTLLQVTKRSGEPIEKSGC